ncbi:TRC40/GET3/ArsA family transport-energizing ATPase [Synechococcus elongatus]|uniref:arsenite-transporting ATPase n=1 Tax=Synechococcus elongatus (strain ATCC 33912 / PCC 7942 / FACHB-805) TaxID=1140 RepID=Q31NT0_SYNE7|nr:TRC40/GET3/ArsA family transport-energizing ATPase [Synechococcus elongatus]ABB57289.1 arsenite-activated ATPase (arsA) [Synechococcus elongatus PCC 7942 = FACHB-805]AJD58198.1 arsenic ABC transporter ATPase [Synechococcus elongatus UTEX 2973]MBD2587696.1 TRC40/GET3/ArsA family transport-energizing ATPase [Synechococcus elongatus FACHB-242]MBD2688525.1 TRC40/GET3/ArsA family transport-energizing ATPase [Synechococcus elongatus FACHB-1061]MBD2707596.1 TRC40/GET3/ArsA family transport-energiz
MRVILMTGKGGVGKTSVAAATGLRCAELGYKTLVLSTDPAHSLADSFDMELGHEPREVKPNLWGAELDALMELEGNWGAVKRYITDVLQARGLEGIEAEELAILPGMDEIFSLVRMKRHYDEGEYEVLIIDSAPTGTALRLLSLPEVAGWYMRKLYKPFQAVSEVLRPLVQPLFRPVAGFNLPTKEVMDAPYEFYEQLVELEKVLTDPGTTSVRLVTNPEKMVIKESLRAHAYLSLYNVGTDLVIANRIIPDSVTDPFFQRWKENQKQYRDEIHADFQPLPIKEVPLYSEEMCGLEALERLKETLYANEDPTQVYYKETTLRVVQNGSDYNLEVYLPGIPKSQIDLSKNGDELNIRIGNHRRNLVLPQALAALSPMGASMEDDYLKIRFAAS